MQSGFFRVAALGSWDQDGDGLDAAEELLLNTDAGNADSDGDGASDPAEFLAQTDPTDFFNGQAPLLAAVSGGGQTGGRNMWLPVPLGAEAAAPGGGVLTNAPLEWSADDGLLAATSGGAGEGFLATRTGPDGRAHFYWKLSSVLGTQSVTVAAVSGTNRAELRFTAVATNAPPAVALTEPTNALAVPGPAALWVRASAGDPDGSVTNVAFFDGSNLIGVDATAPFAVYWSNAPIGAHALTAVAWDGDGAAATNGPVTVTVFDPDADGDGSPDAWETQWFGSTTNPLAAGGADPDGDGRTNGWERLEGTSPLDYYDGIAPVLEIVGGNGQGTGTDAFVPLPLEVRVRRAGGLVLSNAPVAFTASAGRVAAATNGTQLVSLTNRTDGNGVARVYYKTPGSVSTNTITAAAAAHTNIEQVAFTAYAGTGKPTLSVLAPDAVASEPGANRGRFEIVRTGNPWITVTALYSMAGTAAAGADYEALPGAVALPSGVNTAAVELVALDDTEQDAGETAVLRLTSHASYNLGGPSSNTVTIIDNDSGNGTASIEAGDEYSAAVMYDGTVWTWGSDSSGVLGNGSGAGSTNRPAQVPGLNGVKEIACGGKHMLALLNNGTVKAWGEGGSGRLGNNGTGDQQSPDSVDNLNNAIAVAAGDDHSLAINAAGGVLAWGDNREGQVAVGTTTDSYDQPQATSLSAGVVRIAAARRGSFALYGLALRGAGTARDAEMPCGQRIGGNCGAGI